MTLQASPDKPRPRTSTPWESIDSHETDNAIQTDVPSGDSAQAAADQSAGFFLEPPEGDWAIADLAAKPADLQTLDEDEPVSAESTDADQSIFFARETPDDEPWPMNLEEDEHLPRASAGGGWTIAAVCIGLGIVAACAIIPQADMNHQLVYQHEKLRLDLAQIQKQVEINREFLKRVESDPQLTERLAQREMRTLPAGTALLNLNHPVISTPDSPSASAERMSPFLIVKLPPPAALPPYTPVGGVLSTVCRQPHSRLYLLGTGMFLVAAGLVLGDSATPTGSADPLSDDFEFDELQSEESVESSD